MKTKGELESEISKAVIRFEKEYMGRGPLDARTYLIDDMVLVRLKNVLTPAEHKLADAEQNERGRPLLDTVIQDICGVPVRSLHTDISTRTGERIIVFTLESKPTLRDG